MRLLLDTHIFLWYISGDVRLSDNAKWEIRSTDNDVYLSVVSIWESLVKYRLGKLPLPEAPGIYLTGQRERHGISSLPIEEASVSRLENLPDLHRDPFDRMLVCQAMHHDLTLVTVDDEIRNYPVKIL